MAGDRKARILVVDGDPAICGGCCLMLEEAGYEVSAAEDGISALLQLSTRVPDLIVAGLYPPCMSGFELLPVLNRRFPQIPVVIMTATGTVDSLPADFPHELLHEKAESPESLLKAIADRIRTSPLEESGNTGKKVARAASCPAPS